VSTYRNRFLIWSESKSSSNPNIAWLQDKNLVPAKNKLFLDSNNLVIRMMSLEILINVFSRYNKQCLIKTKMKSIDYH